MIFIMIENSSKHHLIYSILSLFIAVKTRTYSTEYFLDEKRKIIHLHSEVERSNTINSIPSADFGEVKI